MDEKVFGEMVEMFLKRGFIRAFNGEDKAFIMVTIRLDHALSGSKEKILQENKISFSVGPKSFSMYRESAYEFLKMALPYAKGFDDSIREAMRFHEDYYGKKALEPPNTISLRANGKDIRELFNRNGWVGATKYQKHQIIILSCGIVGSDEEIEVFKAFLKERKISFFTNPKKIGMSIVIHGSHARKFLEIIGGRISKSKSEIINKYLSIPFSYDGGEAMNEQEYEQVWRDAEALKGSYRNEKEE